MSVYDGFTSLYADADCGYGNWSSRWVCYLSPAGESLLLDESEAS